MQKPLAGAPVTVNPNPALLLVVAQWVCWDSADSLQLARMVLVVCWVQDNLMQARSQRTSHLPLPLHLRLVVV